ncbi:amino acid ABC transporter permease [Candidatus Babeliales bacterium]|nr:amino acid ABC transporter permease [Candidatus Babeliales bacterium]
MFDFSIVQEFGWFFVSGIQTTIAIALLSCCIGITLGCLLGIVLSLRNLRIVRSLIMAYVIVIRGTPMLIQVAALYYMLNFAGYNIPAFWSAVISIGMNSAAYMSQIMLSGINSVHKGQWEAAKVLGFNQVQTMWYIILPQAIRTVVPAFGNELVTLVKDSSLASIIGVYELTQQANVVISQTYDAPTVYVFVGCTYLVITSVLSLLVSWLDKKMQYHA